MEYDYIILDDIYLDREIDLVIGRDVEKFDARMNEVTMTLEQLSDIIVNAVKHERQRKGDKDEEKKKGKI